MSGTRIPISRRHTLLAVGGLAFLAGLMYADVMFRPGGIVASSLDVPMQEAPFRGFVFGEMEKGHLPLWNPHIMSGTPLFPFFGPMYPPYLIYLVLPLSKALNADIALHLFLLGAFTFAWRRARGGSLPASFMAGAVLMFSQTVFVRTYAGHLCMMAVFAWVPLLFLAVDLVFDGSALDGCLLGILAATMQILTGSMGVVFYIAVAVGLYCGLHMMGLLSHPRRLRARALMNVVVALGAIAVGAMLVGAVQLWPSLQAAQEITRSQGVPYDFAKTFSYPPKNLLLLLAPTFFGTVGQPDHWGPEWGYWEVTLSIGVVALLLALHGAVRGEPANRYRMLALAGLLFLIALGQYTPVHGWLYRWVPGFDRLRAPGRFLFLVALCLSVLAAMGVDRLIRERKRPLALIIVAATLAVLLAASALAILVSASHSPIGYWAAFVDNTLSHSNLGWPPSNVPYARMAHIAARSLLLSALFCVLLAAILWFLRNPSPPDAGGPGTRRRFWPVYATIGLAVAEVFLLARLQRPEVKIPPPVDPQLTAALSTMNKDDRVLDLQLNDNRTMTMGCDTIWGYNPVVMERYAKFVGFSQGDDPSPGADRMPYGSGVNPPFREINNMLRMLRCRYVLPPLDAGGLPIDAKVSIPRFLLVRDYKVVSDSHEILSMLRQPTFNPTRTVLLETAPDPPPNPAGTGGVVKLIESSTDRMVLDVDLPSAAILVITDSYSKDWIARPVAPGPQEFYQLLPAYYTLRAIPLSAGKHALAVEFTPSGFQTGKWVSLAAAFLLLICTAIRAGFTPFF